MTQLENNVKELETIASYLDGELDESDPDLMVITIYTDDNTSKENHDNLLDIINDIEPMLHEYCVVDDWADHNTQLITFN